MKSNGDSGFDKLRRRLLLYGGLLGMFAYVFIIEFLARPFHAEFILAFVAMMGVGILQGVDKK